MAARRRSGFAGRSLARSMSGLRMFFRWLEAEEIARNRAVLQVALPKVPHGIPKPLTVEKAAAVVDGGAASELDWIAARDTAVLLLLYGSGLRISEALGIRRKDAPTAERDVLRVVGKGGKERLVPVLPVTRDAIARYIALCPYPLAPDTPLFLGAKGGRLSPRIVQLVVRAAARHAGPARHRDAARAAALVRDAPALGRRRPAPDPGTAGARQPVDHAGLHGSGPRAPARRLRQGPPARLIRLVLRKKRRARHDRAPVTCTFAVDMDMERPMHLRRKVLAVLALLAAHAGLAQAQTPACTGKNVLDELRESDQAAHARVVAAAESTENANAILWKIEKAGASPSHLFGTMHLTDDRINALSSAVKGALADSRRLALELEDLVAGRLPQRPHRQPADGCADDVHRRPPPRSAPGSGGRPQGHRGYVAIRHTAKHRRHVSSVGGDAAAFRLGLRAAAHRRRLAAARCKAGQGRGGPRHQGGRSGDPGVAVSCPCGSAGARAA